MEKKIKNKNAQALGKKSWEARKSRIKNPSKYFSELKKGKKPKFDTIPEFVVDNL